MSILGVIYNNVGILLGGCLTCEGLVGVTWRVPDCEELVGVTWRLSDCKELSGGYSQEMMGLVLWGSFL